jgi:large subunit ribosomal protein L19
MANHIVWTGKDGDKELTADMHVGDTVRVHYKLIEKEKVSGKTKREVKEETRERIQVFEGIVIAIKGSNENAMFMVRKIGAAAVGIERIFPVISPWIRKIEIKKHGAVKRAKLYYLRGKIGRDATRIAEATKAPAAK